MWDTPQGIRKLTGRERALFLAGALSLFDELRDLLPEDDCDHGVPAFDTLPLETRPWIVLLVAEAVLGDGEAQGICAWNAGAVSAVFTRIEGGLEFEIEMEDPQEDVRSRTYWRRLVHEAWMEVVFPELESASPEGEGEKQLVTSRDLEEWQSKIELLREEVLHDDDAAMDDLMDLPPEAVGKVKDELGISEDFYTAIPPVLSPEDLNRLAGLHRKLLEEERHAAM